jgi:hypothetical protein
MILAHYFGHFSAALFQKIPNSDLNTSVADPDLDIWDRIRDQGQICNTLCVLKWTLTRKKCFKYGFFLFAFTIQIEILSFATHCFFYSGSSEKYRIKPVSAFLPPSPVGEQTGDEKLAGILFPWQPLVKL